MNNRHRRDVSIPAIRPFRDIWPSAVSATSFQATLNTAFRPRLIPLYPSLTTTWNVEQTSKRPGQKMSTVISKRHQLQTNLFLSSWAISQHKNRAFCGNIFFTLHAKMTTRHTNLASIKLKGKSINQLHNVFFYQVPIRKNLIFGDVILAPIFPIVPKFFHGGRLVINFGGSFFVG